MIDVSNYERIIMARDSACCRVEKNITNTFHKQSIATVHIGQFSVDMMIIIRNTKHTEVGYITFLKIP
jgi:hypothetical protein